MNKKILRLEKQIAEASGNLKSLIEEYQSKCTHKLVIEAPYKEETYVTYAAPDFRVCKECGYAEEGWGCGYWKLSNPEFVGCMPRDEARNYVKGKFWTQEEMSKLRFGITK